MKVFLFRKKYIFPFFFEIDLVELQILKLHHSLHKINNLFYIMRFTSSFSLCHLEFHKNMLKPRSICVTSLTSCIDGSGWFNFLYKAILHVVNDLWV
jgi:hypothetical protein